MTMNFCNHALPMILMPQILFELSNDVQNCMTQSLISHLYQIVWPVLKNESHGWMSKSKQ